MARESGDLTMKREGLVYITDDRAGGWLKPRRIYLQ